MPTVPALRRVIAALLLVMATSAGGVAAAAAPAAAADKPTVVVDGQWDGTGTVGTSMVFTWYASDDVTIYVCGSDDITISSDLIARCTVVAASSGRTGTVTFTVPDQPGGYLYAQSSTPATYSVVTPPHWISPAPVTPTYTWIWGGTPEQGATMTVRLEGYIGWHSGQVRACKGTDCVVVPSTIDFQTGATFVVPDLVDHQLSAGLDNGLVEGPFFSGDSGPTILPATGPPTISGTAEVGSQLTAGPGRWEHLTSDEHTYEWFACRDECVSVRAASNVPTYTVARSDEGATIKVTATAFVDGVERTSWSAPSAVVPAAAPVATSPTTISGTGLEGSALRAEAGGWVGNGEIVLAYRWLGCSIPDPGDCDEVGTGQDHVVAASDVGRWLYAEVTATNAFGTATSSSELLSISRAPAVITPASFSSAPYVGAAVRLTPAVVVGGIWPLTTTWVWQRCIDSVCSDIAGTADAVTYTPTAADLGATLQVVTTATSVWGTATDTAGAGVVTEPPAPVATVAPTLSGTAVVGDVLTGSSGMWSHSVAFAYSWMRCDDDQDSCGGIDAAGTTYRVTDADVGYRVVFITTATGPGGSTSAEAASDIVTIGLGGPTHTTPTVAGTARVGETLDAATPDWTAADSTHTWAWQRCDASGSSCTDIADARDATYTVTADDIASAIRVLVTITSPTGDAWGASATTPVVVAAPTADLASSTIEAGGTVTVTGSGFGPDTTAVVELHSDPVTLGTAATDAAGTFTATFGVPAGIAPGVHRIVVSGVDAAGNPVTLSQTVTVTSAATPGPPQGPTRPDDGVASPPADRDAPTAAPGGAAAAGPPARDGLAVTGISLSSLLALALGLLAAGAAAAASTRRRV